MIDTIQQSIFRGRVGAVILASVSAGLTAYGISAEEQEILVQATTIITALGAAGLSAMSKYREGKK